MTGDECIRTDPVRGTYSLYGPSRAHRPSDSGGAVIQCPFCPGNERLTGALLTADPGMHWESRVVANLYPAVVEPAGRHEVIIDMRDHDADWSTLDATVIERVLQVYRARERAGYADGYAFVSIFKNSGAPAGASLRHPHTQVLTLRTLPDALAARVGRLTGACPICATVAAAPERVVLRTAEIAAYVPDGSRTAFEVHLAPVRHASRLSDGSDLFLRELAQALRQIMKRLAAVLGERFPFNIVVQSAPQDARARTLMHWEIEVVPRRENFGGFELSSGGYLVSRTPEAAAAVLRAGTAAHA